jgi:hypothetical protein
VVSNPAMAPVHRLLTTTVWAARVHTEAKVEQLQATLASDATRLALNESVQTVSQRPRLLSQPPGNPLIASSRASDVALCGSNAFNEQPRVWPKRLDARGHRQWIAFSGSDAVSYE